MPTRRKHQRASVQVLNVLQHHTDVQKLTRVGAAQTSAVVELLSRHNDESGESSRSGPCHTPKSQFTATGTMMRANPKLEPRCTLE